jgi:hypothetical protein
LIVAPVAVVVVSLGCAAAASVAVFTRRPGKPAAGGNPVENFFFLEVGDGVLDVICFVLTSSEGDLDFRDDPQDTVKNALLASVIFSFVLMVVEAKIALSSTTNKERVRDWLPLMYCVHLAFEDVFQVFVYAAVSASQARSGLGSSHLAGLFGALQAAIFSFLKVRDVLFMPVEDYDDV